MIEVNGIKVTVNREDAHVDRTGGPGHEFMSERNFSIDAIDRDGTMYHMRWDAYTGYDYDEMPLHVRNAMGEAARQVNLEL